MTSEARQSARDFKKAQNWLHDISRSDVDLLITDLREGFFDWRDYFNKKPSKAFMNGLFYHLSLLEQMYS